MYTLVYLQWITNKDLSCSTGNSDQWYMPAWMGVGFGEMGIHVHGWLSPFTVFAWNYHNIVIWLYPNIK